MDISNAAARHFSRFVLLAVTALLTACSLTPAGIKEYRVETLVSGGPLHGAKGIEFGPDGYLYVCTVYAQTVYRVDVTTGAVEVAVGAPHGESDDIAFGPDGMMAWTALPSGELRAKRPGGEPFVLADNLMLINPVGFTTDGRLFAGQIGIDRFIEIDVNGVEPPRLVAKGIGHLNSFEITSDNQLYGPLAGIGTLAKIDLATGVVTPIAEGLDTLSAVNLDSQGRIYAVGWDTGRLLRFDEATGEHELVTKLDPPVDNIAIDEDDNIYASIPARGAIIKIDADTGAQTEVIPGNMGIPGGIALTQLNGKEVLVVADDYGYRHVDTATGEIWATINLAEFMDTNQASDVAVSDELIVISDITRSIVYSVNRFSGEKTHVWKRIAQPYGLVILDSGDPLVAEFESGQILRLSREDKKSRDVVAESLAGPVGLVRAGADSLYVTEATAGNLTQINIQTGEKTVIASGLNQPEGLTMLEDGLVAVVEVGNQRVVAVDPVTGDIRMIAENLPIGLSLPGNNGPVHVPSGIAAGKNGVLYLSSDLDQSLLKLVPKN